MDQSKTAVISVRARESDGLLLERYAYTSGSVEPLPKHVHEEYQFGLSFDCAGEYRYRGACYAIPTGSLSVIHSGEVHAPSDRTYLPAAAHFEMMHIHPKWLGAAAAEMAEKPVSLPFFSAAFVTDSTLNNLFLALSAVGQTRSHLEQDVALWNFLSYLIAYHTSTPPLANWLQTAPAAILRTRDYLQAYYAQEVSLEGLAAIAGLSRFHFCRLFRKQLGVSPSVYQTQLRIAQAKKLLLQGYSITAAAELTGFYDQSHFGWHFKRQVGVTPGRYLRKAAIIS